MDKTSLPSSSALLELKAPPTRFTTAQVSNDDHVIHRYAEQTHTGGCRMLILLLEHQAGPNGMWVSPPKMMSFEATPVFVCGVQVLLESSGGTLSLQGSAPALYAHRGYALNHLQH
jgi:hypothetical protein